MDATVIHSYRFKCSLVLTSLLLGLPHMDPKSSKSATRFRMLLLTHNPPIEKVIQSFVAPRFLEFLHRDDFPQLRVCFKLVYLFEIYVVWCS